MRRLFLLLIAVLIAAAPVVADVCRVDCERERQPVCPLHQQAPHKCLHEHSIVPGTLSGAHVDAPPPAFVAIATVASLANAIVTTRTTDVASSHAPPLRSPRIDVLRI